MGYISMLQIPLVLLITIFSIVSLCVLNKSCEYIYKSVKHKKHVQQLCTATQIIFLSKESSHKLF